MRPGEVPASMSDKAGAVQLDEQHQWSGLCSDCGLRWQGGPDGYAAHAATVHGSDL